MVQSHICNCGSRFFVVLFTFYELNVVEFGSVYVASIAAFIHFICGAVIFKFIKNVYHARSKQVL